jgi:hypothetical protein
MASSVLSARMYPFHIELAGVSGNRNLIGVDMGGTCFDFSLVVDGKPDVSTEAHLEGLPMLMSVGPVSGRRRVRQAEADELRGTHQICGDRREDAKVWHGGSAKGENLYDWFTA